MAEPSGLMDGKVDPKCEDFTICDLADEEVHFSREPISRSFELLNNHNHAANNPSNSANKTHITGASTSQTRQHSHDSIRYQNLLPYYSSTDSNWNSSSNINTGCSSMSNDQAKSYRLLHNLGTKLRRGSNYLIAPKLVGQYLLGITIQSWAEFFNTSRLMKAPANKQHLTKRVLGNLSYFQGNYLCVSLVLVVYCILTSPLLLLALLTYAVALYLVTVRSALGKPTCFFGYRFNLQQQYSLITMVSLPLLWVAGAPTALFWVIGASFFVVGLHALLYANEALPIIYASPHQYVVPGDTSSTHTNHLYAPGTNIPLSTIGPRYQYQNLSDQSRRQYAPGEHSPAGRSNRATAYYDHHPQSITHSYLPLEPTATNNGQRTTSNYLYQWIPFGRRGSTASLTATDDPVAGRKPEVKIISQDYAGLGRVYEV